MRSLIWSTTQITVHQLYNRHFFPKIIYLRHAWRSWITCNRELRCPASQVASCCLWPYLWSTNTSFYSCLIVRLKSRHQSGSCAASQVAQPLSLTVPLKHKYFFSFLFDSTVKIKASIRWVPSKLGCRAAVFDYTFETQILLFIFVW